MSSFTTKGNGRREKVGQYLQMGTQDAKITKIECKIASTGSVQVNFNMENEVNVPEGVEFTPVEGANGQVGRVQTSIYMKDEASMQNWINERIIPIAQSMGVLSEVDAINVEASDPVDKLHQYVEAVSPLITNKSIKWTIGGEEYLGADGNIKTKLMLPRYSFVGDRAQDFDKSNKYHFKKVDNNQGMQPVGATPSDLPF